ncbi:MAG: hypothetical protein O2816_00160 [Planctomycetota bacterium]|nr:hypothetical protein [Planctomycetota bacterium]
MQRKLLILLFALVGLTSPAQADVLVPGTAPVRHKFEIRGLDQAPAGTKFFLFPAYMGGGPTQIFDGEPFSFYKFCDPKIYAYTGALPEFEDERVVPDLPASEFELSLTSAVKESSATRAITTVYQFDGIEGDVVKLSLVSDTHFDADGNEIAAGTSRMNMAWLCLPCLGLLLLGGIVVRGRRKPAVQA